MPNSSLHFQVADHTIEDYFISFRQGYQNGFNYFFELYYKQLVHFASSIVKDAELAKDVVEDCFVKLWEKRETLASASSVKPYLFTAVRNKCLNILEKQKHQNTYKLYIQKLPLEISADITHKIIASESMHQVFIALQNLPSKYRQLINMLYFEEKPVKQIARDLDLPLSTVKSQKQRALQLLKNQLPHLGIMILFFLFN